MPPYPGLRHCMEIANERMSSLSDKVDDSSQDDQDWAVQYQAYLDEQDAMQQHEHQGTAEIQGEDWAVQYAEHCMEKEKEFFETNPLKHE